MTVRRAEGNQARRSSIRRSSASRTANISDVRRKRVRFTNPDSIHTFACKQDMSSQLVTRVLSTGTCNYDEPKTSEYKSFRKLLEEALGEVPSKERSEFTLVEHGWHKSKEGDRNADICEAEAGSSHPELSFDVRSHGPMTVLTPAKSLVIAVKASPTLRNPSDAEHGSRDYFQKARNRLLKVMAETWSLEFDDLISNGSNLIPIFLERLGIGSKQKNHELDHHLSENSEVCMDHLSSSSSSKLILDEHTLLKENRMLTATKKNKGKLTSEICGRGVHEFLSPSHENKENCRLSTRYSQRVNAGYSKEMDFSMDSWRDLPTDMGSTYKLDSGIASPWNLNLPPDSLDLSFSDGGYQIGPHKNKAKYMSQLCHRKTPKFFSPLHENKENCRLLTWDSPGAVAHEKAVMDYSTGFRRHLTDEMGSSYFSRSNRNGGDSPCPTYFSDLNFSEVRDEGVPYRSYTDYSIPFQISPLSSSLEPSSGTCNLHLSGFHKSSSTNLSMCYSDLDFSEGSHESVPYRSDSGYFAAFQFSSPFTFLKQSFDNYGAHLSGLEVIHSSDRKSNTSCSQCPWPLLEFEHDLG